MAEVIEYNQTDVPDIEVLPTIEALEVDRQFKNLIGQLERAPISVEEEAGLQTTYKLSGTADGGSLDNHTLHND